MRAKKKATKKRLVARSVKKKATKKPKKKKKHRMAWALVVVKQQEELETLQDEVRALHNMVEQMNADQAATEQDAAVAKGYLRSLYQLWIELDMGTHYAWSEQSDRQVRELAQKIEAYFKPKKIAETTIEEPREADVGERVVPDAEPL